MLGVSVNRTQPTTADADEVQVKLMTARHHKKSERVKAHLNACIPFRHTFADVASSDVPDWIILKGRAQHTKGMSQSKSNTSISLLTTPAKKKSRTMKDYILPALSKTEYTAFEADLAMHYYMTGTSFARMEEPHFLEALKKLRPNSKLPSRKDLGGRLLDDADRNVKEKVDGWLGHDRYGCITTDSWSNIKNEAVINYMFVSEDTNLFLESKQTGEFSHTATYLASDLSRVIEGIATGHVAGAIMDNTSANKAAWLILKEGHPELFFQGCVAHGLHLLVKDIFAATKARRGRVVADYPDQYAFEYLLVFTMKCKAIVKFFHN